MQSDKNLTTQTYFLLFIQQMESFIKETKLQVNKENDQCGEFQKLINIFYTQKFQKS